ncbi:MAG: class I SAM-dependent methyltransferase [Spirochaetales bacterium]|nr:class I SAM-dependent methyltransferase [Spirochaetales bacterium]
MKTGQDILLKTGREKNLLQRHPWIFSGALQPVRGNPEVGATVRVCSSDGTFLGLGAWSPHSQIRVRLWSFPGDEGPADEEGLEQLIRGRIAAAVKMRRAMGLFSPQGACRLVHAESDGLPGLVADWYAGFLCLQFLSAGAEYWKSMIVDTLAGETGARGVYERSDVQVRSQEGLPHVSGTLKGEEPPELLEIREGDARLAVDLRRGHKTGFYLDQGKNRLRIAEAAVGKRVLNCFCYTGALDVHALKAGARHVTGIDSSREALELAGENMRRNGFEPEKLTYRTGDVFQALRTLHTQGETFDLIILDPPKFIDSKARIAGGCRGYKDIALGAFRLLEPGGLLCTFSCSGLLSPELFQKITADAALDAGCAAQIVDTFTQNSDHPVLLSFPEGAYLKGLLVRKLDDQEDLIPHG